MKYQRLIWVYNSFTKPRWFLIDFLNSRFYELLFRHIFETQIHIQTKIWESFILLLATNDFLQLLLKYRKNFQQPIYWLENKFQEIRHSLIRPSNITLIPVKLVYFLWVTWYVDKILRIFFYTLLALAEVWKIFPETRHFVNKFGRSSYIRST